MSDIVLAPEDVPRNSALRAEGRIVGPKWPIAIVAMVGALIAVLDVSIINVALPSIRASLGASLQDTSWISTGYIISNVIIIPMTGFFQRRVGFRPYFIGSLILFTLASMLCALAWNLPSLVLFRVLQGLGGGALIPTASSIMLDRFPRAERNMAMAMFGLGAMMGPMLGPSLGGFLTDQFSWHMIFLVNVPIGIIEILLVTFLLREDRTGITPEPVDWTGIAWLIVGLSTMQYVLEEGQGEGWFDSGLILGLTLTSLSAAVMFIHHELTTPFPVVKLRLFADQQYTMGTLINMGLGLALFSGVYLFSLFCGVVLNYKASDTGGIIFWAAMSQLMFMPLIGRFGGLFDPRKLVALGVTLMAASLYLNSRLTGYEGQFDMLIPQICRAVGMSFIFIPVGTLALDKIATKDTADATGLFNLTRELGGSVGTATLATVITTRTTYHSQRIAEGLSTVSPIAQTRLAEMTQRFTGTFGDPDRGAHAALASMQGSISRQALIFAFNDAFAIATCVALVLLLVVVTMKRPSQNSGGLASAAH